MMEWLLKPCFGALLSALLFKGVFRFLIPSGLHIWLNLIFSILFLCAGYFLLLILMNCITKSEMKWISEKMKAPLHNKQAKDVTMSSFLI